MRSEVMQKVEVHMEEGEDGTVTAHITTTTEENGEVKKDQQIISGSKEEVKAKVEALKSVDSKGKVITEIKIEE